LPNAARGFLADGRNSRNAPLLVLELRRHNPTEYAISLFSSTHQI
jgi:hypothetical protein